VQIFRGKNFRQKLLTRRDLCSLGEQLFRESTKSLKISCAVSLSLKSDEQLVEFRVLVYEEQVSPEPFPVKVYQQ
jgi:hypothetical protein